MGLVWLGLMYLLIHVSFAFSDAPSLPDIMKWTGDFGTVLAFAMIYFRNPFLEKYAVDNSMRQSGVLDWNIVKSKFGVFIYDVLSYVLAWHALVAIVLRHDWLISIVGESSSEILLALIVVTFLLAGYVLIRGYQKAAAVMKSPDE